MCKQLDLFENEIGRNARNSLCLANGEHAERVYRLLSDGYRHTVVEMVRSLGIADPRSVIRVLRKGDIEVLDKWETSASGARYKSYWIENAR